MQNTKLKKLNNLFPKKHLLMLLTINFLTKTNGMVKLTTSEKLKDEIYKI